MSNNAVGLVYQQIIERVIQASQNDFEEFGVDQSTLDEMKQGWQEKLSGLKVAQFPWDPQPEPPRQPPTVPSNVKPEHELLPPVSAPQDGTANYPGAPIKSERAYEPPLSSYPQAANGGYAGGFNGEIAQQRAHALVAQRMHQQQTQPQQQQHGGPINMQQQQQQYQYQQQQRMHAAQQQQQAQQQRPPQPMQQRPPQPGHPYNPSQTDGSGDAREDWKALVAARRAVSPEDRAEADLLMRARLDALASRQDSGLMMPLDRLPKGRRRKAAVRVLQEEDATKAASSATAPASDPARFDGEDSKEEEHDSDAINSDLDDPEDDDNNGDDSDDETMDYMLCTYDKVQRVKNKWKCTLKDGILTTNKRE
ncbi:transcription factor IIA subunit alpha [Paraconiothyrium brasiliense]|uniref:Transcription factor IIA subunit alpha n=1 Tax=Paraconiothyrium brasiliense TaxID=300254 RepID=A0ABR3S7Y3_9PLEO